MVVIKGRRGIQIEYLGQHQMPLIDFPNHSNSWKHSHLLIWVQHSCSMNGWVCCTWMIYLNTSAVFSESERASKEIYVSFWIDCTPCDPMILMFWLTYWLFFWPRTNWHSYLAWQKGKSVSSSSWFVDGNWCRMYGFQIHCNITSFCRHLHQYD